MIMENKTKKIVRDKYSEIAEGLNAPGCCGAETSCCGGEDTGYMMEGDNYKNLKGYTPDADLGLGCGLPTEYAGIKNGDTVVDLGCGAGNDVFIARTLTGDEGKVIGIDMTEKMIAKAEANKAKSGYTNIEFRLGDIEDLPLEDNFADVVVSNCVLNLVPDKHKAFSEIYRTLKPGAHFCISDIVIDGSLPEKIKQSAEMYAGCVAGALQKEEYLGIISEAGFSEVKVVKAKQILLPSQLLKEYLSGEEIERYNIEGAGIFSVTVTGIKK